MIRKKKPANSKPITLPFKLSHWYFGLFLLHTVIIIPIPQVTTISKIELISSANAERFYIIAFMQ